MTSKTTNKTKVFIIVGEESGDQLGASLMEGLIHLLDGRVTFAGVGGDRMKELGFKSIFPLDDIAVMGITAVFSRLPTLIRRVSETANAVISDPPDVLVIIDSPDFTHRVAKRVRNSNSSIPIVDYVSPSVWAWRPNRARKMSKYIDRVLSILPFEVEVHKRLGGPKCDYVGHPLLDKLEFLRPNTDNVRIPPDKTKNPILLVMPGSRISEIDRLLPPFRETVEQILFRNPNIELILPAVPYLEGRIREKTSDWDFDLNIIVGESEKFSAFRRAHAALAASGTASLELALSGIPMVIAYKVDWFMKGLYLLNKVFPIGSIDSMVLPNIILGRKVVPEFLNESVTPQNMAPILEMLLENSSDRSKQISAFEELNSIMKPESRDAQNELAGKLVLDTISQRVSTLHK